MLNVKQLIENVANGSRAERELSKALNESTNIVGTHGRTAKLRFHVFDNKLMVLALADDDKPGPETRYFALTYHKFNMLSPEAQNDVGELVKSLNHLRYLDALFAADKLQKKYGHKEFGWKHDTIRDYELPKELQ